MAKDLSKLTEIVKDLINTQKENDYYDFKQEWQQNNVDLIKDIICLANVKYDGNRYLIFGVSDKEFDIIGLENNPNLPNQQKLIDLLQNANFADNNFPDIFVDTINIENKKIDVITILNKKEKPYYLTKDKEDKEDQKKYIRAGTIYSRKRDVNTAKNKVASSNDIEHMWKERFGLTSNVFDKFKIYLQDLNSWITNDYDKGECILRIDHGDFADGIKLL